MRHPETSTKAESAPCCACSPDAALTSWARDGHRLVTRLLGEASSAGRHVAALLVPQSADAEALRAAAGAYGSVRDRRFRRIVLLASGGAHAGALLPDRPELDATLGAMAVDTAAVKLLSGYPRMALTREAVTHPAIAVQLPFVRHLWPQAKLVPVALGAAAPDELAAIGRALRNVLDEDTLLVASTGLHAPPAVGSGEFDSAAMRFMSAVLARDGAEAERLHGSGTLHACGFAALQVMASALGAQAFGFPGGVSIEAAADCVPPFAALFPGRYPAVPELDDEDRLMLGAIAEDAVAAEVTGRDARRWRDLSPRLLHPGGAFVTLTSRGMLKGCIGRLMAGSLADAVAIAGRQAASGDPRFHPLRPDELGSIELEVSVLGPFVEIESPLDFEPKRHGLLLTRGFNRGLLLPQVATKYGLDRDAFLEALAEKAGLDGDGWRDAKLERFGVQAFFPTPSAD